MTKDYYKILNVEKTATQDDIKKAFRKLAHQHHPDKGNGDEKKFKEANEAYQTLKNPQKRQQYDQFGSTFEQARSQGGFSGFEGFANAAGGGANQQGFSFDMGDLGDMFGDLFGGGGRGRGRAGQRASRGVDIETNLMVEFKEAIFGTEKTISLTKDAPCSKCKGSGDEPGSKISTCVSCKGTGQVIRNIGFGIGIPGVCPECSGKGKAAENQCTRCHGHGVEKVTKNIKIKIPAGVDNGQSIRLTGEGQETQGGGIGDLYIRVSVKPDKNFVRQGYDIITKKEISFSQAALGDKIEIDTVDGKVKLKIPEGTQSGKVFQIKGRGVNYLQSRGRGDQLVKVIVKTPTKLNRRQKELLRELE